MSTHAEPQRFPTVSNDSPEALSSILREMATDLAISRERASAVAASISDTDDRALAMSDIATLLL